MAIPSGYSLLKTGTGSYVGPGSTFRVVAQLYGKDVGNGYSLYLRRYVQVVAGTNGFGGTILTISWGSGSTTLYKDGTYAVTDTDLGTYAYGKTYSLSNIYGTYTGSKTYKSSTSISYTLPVPVYTVSYDANGGSGAPVSHTKTYGVDLVLQKTAPTRTGYNFMGWGISADDTTPDYQPGDTYKTNSGITLYAIWELITYTVLYNANGGSGAPASQTKTYGVPLTLSSTKPTRTGYTFKGWGTSSTDTTSDYQPGDTYTTNDGITLYAIWQIKTYTISYDANGGSGAPGNQTKTYGSALILSGTIPTREGYTFLGWSTSSDATSANYAAGGKYTANKKATLYAVWDACDYVLTLNPNGGTVDTISLGLEYMAGTNADLSGNIPKRYGYEFLGWYTAASGGTKVYDASGLCTNDGTYWKDGVYSYAGNLTLYAQWEMTATVNVYPDGERTPGMPYVYVDGEWKMGYAHIYVNGEWKTGIT